MTRTLLAIDIQNEYFPGGSLPLWQSEETEARIVKAIGKAQAAGENILLVQHVSNAPSGLFSANSHGVAIRPTILACAHGAPIVQKQYADAFQETNLAEHLVKTKELLVCGMMTQNCVVFTVLSRAADRYRLRVISDLCTAPSEIVHRIALRALGSKVELLNYEDIWT